MVIELPLPRIVQPGEVVAPPPPPDDYDDRRPGGAQGGAKETIPDDTLALSWLTTGEVYFGRISPDDGTKVTTVIPWNLVHSWVPLGRDSDDGKAGEAIGEAIRVTESTYE